MSIFGLYCIIILLALNLAFSGPLLFVQFRTGVGINLDTFTAEGDLNNNVLNGKGGVVVI